MNKNLLQLTLAIVKPNIIKQPFALEAIRHTILENGFKVVRSKRSALTLYQAELFYEEHRNRFFFKRLTTFMSSGASDFYILAKINAIDDWRRVMGPTKVYKAQFEAPNSIRGLYGFSDTRNATHGSDSSESASREIKLFFPNFNLDDWYRNEEPLFRQNKVIFVKDRFVHVPDIK